MDSSEITIRTTINHVSLSSCLGQKFYYGQPLQSGITFFVCPPLPLQDLILQDVVADVFQDRTVLTIAVSVFNNISYAIQTSQGSKIQIIQRSSLLRRRDDLVSDSPNVLGLFICFENEICGNVLFILYPYPKRSRLFLYWQRDLFGHYTLSKKLLNITWRLSQGMSYCIFLFFSAEICIHL